MDLEIGLDPDYVLEMRETNSSNKFPDSPNWLIDDIRDYCSSIKRKDNGKRRVSKNREV